MLQALKESALEAAETVYAARIQPPPGAREAGRLTRVAYGLGLPLGVAGALLRDPAARRRYLRTCALQAGVTLVAGLVFGVNWDQVAPLLGDSVRLEAGHGRVVMDVSDLEHGGVAFWSSLYATLCVVEWIVLALSRDYQDVISRDAALISGAPPDDPPIEPRVRVDLAWMKKRAARYIRAWKVLIVGLPALALLTLIPIAGPSLYAAASALWAAYWVAISVTAKSGEAWREEGTAGPPWFLRGWSALTERVPGFRWSLPRTYGRLWARHTQALFSPAARFERSPWELAGVALARALSGVPGLYFFFRPLIPVAAAHILVAQNAAATAAADAPAAAPAPEEPAAPPAAAA